MQNVKNKRKNSHNNTKCINNNISSNSSEASKPKERHIVSWSQEEDDILREQIRIHGTENWTIIASKFKDKTTRQCRRRWYTYLNSDFKKGGWSPEEDMLLCEAQRMFGNRWTEIAKVVSGRTDNAVKNRFSTLCKKRAKNEALAKENDTSCINMNNKRVIFQNVLTTDDTAEAPLKKMRRSHISDRRENCIHGEKSLEESSTTNAQLRPPFAVLIQNFHNMVDLQNQQNANSKESSKDAYHEKIQGAFLKKDDSKMFVLMQQEELLCSFGQDVAISNTEHSMNNAWKALQDFLNQTKESEMLRFKLSDVDFQLENFKDFIVDLRNSNEGNQSSWRQPDLYEESSASSDYSTGSTLLSHGTLDKTKQSQAESSDMHQDIGTESQSTCVGDHNVFCEEEKGMVPIEATHQADVLTSCDDTKTNFGAFCTFTSGEFSSPLQVTPIFRSLAAGIPSPKFSESERNFLQKTLGMESPLPIPSVNPSQPPPPCKRALLDSL